MVHVFFCIQDHTVIAVTIHYRIMGLHNVLLQTAILPDLYAIVTE